MSRDGKAPDKFFSVAQVTGQPRECRARDGPGHGRRRDQLVELGHRLQPDAHDQQGHAQEGRRHADEATRISASSGSRRFWPVRRSPISTTCPTDLKKAIAEAFFNAHKKDKAAFDKLSDGKDLAFVPVGHKDYLEFIELNKYLEQLRRKKS